MGPATVATDRGGAAWPPVRRRDERGLVCVAASPPP